MDVRKKGGLVMLLLIVGIVLCIAAIFYFKERIDSNDSPMRCIAGKSHLYVSRTCSFCAQQKILLGESIKYFNITDCLDDMQLCINKEVTRWPAWEIGGQIYLGVRSIEELKELTEC